MVNQYVMKNMKLVKSSSIHSSQVSFDSNASQRKRNYKIAKKKAYQSKTAQKKKEKNVQKTKKVNRKS